VAKKTVVKTRREKPEFALGKVYMQKDPRFYAEKLPNKQPRYARVAGIDLGTNCGIAFCDFNRENGERGHDLVMGQWDLSLGPYDSGPLRHIRLKHFLTVLAPDLVMYEAVKYDPPQEMMKARGHGMGGVVARVATAAEFLGGLKTTLATWCEDHLVPTHGLAIASIKQFATGKGNASKVEMIEAANAQFGTNFDVEGYEKTGVDNIVDAAFCCTMGVDSYSEGLK
jgi:hypothetical protein